MAQVFKYRPLERLADVRQIRCRVPRVNDFIQGELEDALRENNCDTYGVYDGDRLISVFALRADEIFTNSRGEHTAVEISFLVVDKKYELRGIGTAIIKEISNMVVSEYRREKITVEALVITHPNRERYEAVTFYRKCKFLRAEMYNPTKDTLGMYRDAVGYDKLLKTSVRIEREH